MAINTTKGSAYCDFTVTVGGDTIADVIDWSSTLAADLLTNHADGRAYGQIGCSYNHSATIGFTTLQLGSAETSNGFLIGSTVSSVVLLVENHGAGSVTHTIGGTVGAARCISANMTGGHGRLGEMQMAYEAIGTTGADPTVTWVVSSA